MVRTLSTAAAGIAVVLALAVPGWSVVTSDGTSASRRTSTEGLTQEEIGLWNLLGRLGAFYVTPVSARHVLAATHVGGAVGDGIHFDSGPNAGVYTTVGFVDDPDSDLRLWELDGTLSAWVPVYTGSGERNSVVTIFGRGGPPGPEVRIDPAGAVGPAPADLKGWEWGAQDGVGSWGRNIVDRNGFTSFSGLAIAIDLDRPIFGGEEDECHLSGGDSSGPWFLQEAGTWYLAGVTSVESGPFQHDDAGAPNGDFFKAMLFDRGGLWENDPAFFNSDAFTDKPSSAYAVRLSRATDWLLPQLDSDGDGVPDDGDNCTLDENASQIDTDADGYGNACDCDFDQSDACNVGDFNAFLPDFISGSDSGVGTDMDGSGAVNVGDFNRFLPGFVSGQPGPSGLTP